MPTLEFDASRNGEPFLRLPAPLSHIILTPPRESDSQASIGYMNDPRVSMNLSGPPFPYAMSDWEQFHGRIVEKCAEGIAEYHEITANTNSKTEQKWLQSMPVRSLRDTTCVGNAMSDNGQLFIGDIELRKALFLQNLDLEERKKAVEINDSYEPGDERIVWEFGDFIAPSYWGQGIMSAAVKVALDFSMQYFNLHIAEVTYFAENRASRRVFEKNGFVDTGIVPKGMTMSESKGGKVHDLGTMRWERVKN